MTGEAYDHLMAVVVLGALFSMAVFIVPSLSYVNLLYLEQQQLRNIALSALKTILFDEGYPANWGSMHGMNLFNEADVKRFGLALLRDPSFYVLDLDKVQRLSKDNPLGSISYQKMKELLRLSGYDFSIVMRPLFNVKYNVNPGSGDTTRTISFNATVSRYDGQPVPNAIVKASIIYAVDKNPPETKTLEVSRQTDSLGRCQGSQTISVGSGEKIKDVIVIFRVTVADRATIVVSSQDTQDPNDIAKINIVGDNIILTIPKNMTEEEKQKANSQDARWITNIMMYNFETSMNLLDGGKEDKLTYGKGYGVWNQSFPGLSYSEPGVLIFTFDTVIGSRTLALLVGPYALWSKGGVIEFNPVPSSSGASMSVQRDVIIAGMAYVAELRLWKT